MQHRLYAVFDKVAEEAGPVFTAVNDGIAIRQFRNLSRDIPPYDKESYVLLYLGNYDSSKVKIDACESVQEVMTGSQVFGVMDSTEHAK